MVAARLAQRNGEFVPLQVGLLSKIRRFPEYHVDRAMTEAVESSKESYRSFFRRLWRLTYPYWASDEKWSARLLLASIVVLNLAAVYLAVLFNDWYQLFYNALEQKNQPEFWRQFGRFGWLAVINIIVVVYRIYLTQMLEMRWRRWLNQEYLGDWLSDRVYYRMQLESKGTDNPDQRIAEDLKLYTENTLTLSVGLMNSVVTLVSFVTILWTISGPLVFSMFGTKITVPGYMVWAAVLYAIAGSWLTHRIGRRLIPLSFDQQRFEADYRFNLVRIRENNEGIALYGGEQFERSSLTGRFGSILENWWRLIKVNKQLTWFTSGYAQLAIVFPFLVAAPRFFSGAITLGGLLQISNAFGEVRQALSWLVDSYGQVAGWKASVDRLITFSDAMEAASIAQRNTGGIEVEESDALGISLAGLALSVPGGRSLLSDANATIESGSRVLLSGPSGSGKSTIFRAIAGIWPYGRGKVRRPKAKRILFLPQKPYLPIGTLREALAYPSDRSVFSEEALQAALRDCRLGEFLSRLDESQHWAQQLSPGEQQRVAIARALLHRPDWLFLDEATSALDEETEAAMYELLRSKLPDTTVVSIAHRPGVARYHDKRLALVPQDGVMKLAPVL